MNTREWYKYQGSTYPLTIQDGNRDGEVGEISLRMFELGNIKKFAFGGQMTQWSIQKGALGFSLDADWIKISTNHRTSSQYQFEDPFMAHLHTKVRNFDTFLKFEGDIVT